MGSCREHPPAPREVRTLTTVEGYLRYLADDRRLTAELVLADSLGAGARVPRFQDTDMRPVGVQPTNRFKHEAITDYPNTARFSVPAEEGHIDFSFVTRDLSLDSLPDTLSRDLALNLPVAERGLTEQESLLLFFEAADRKEAPRRVLITGPTATGTISLPTSALAAVDTGRYELYVVRRRLLRDQIGALRLSVQSEFFTPTRTVWVVETNND